MNLKKAIAEARKFGITIRKTDFNDLRVNYTNGKEATAYYTNDIADALATALHMAREVV